MSDPNYPSYPASAAPYTSYGAQAYPQQIPPASVAPAYPAAPAASYPAQPVASYPAQPAPPPQEPAPADPASAPALPSALDEQLRQRLGQPLDASLQRELARLLHLRELAPSLLDAAAADSIRLGLLALLAEKPNLHFARNIRARLESRVADQLHPLRLAAVLRTDSPPIQVMLGLGALLLGVLVLAVLGHRWLAGMELQFFHIPLYLLLLAALGGMVGSATSILTRVQDFQSLKSSAPASLVLLGLTKPVVGASFALFSLALLKADMLPIKLPEAGAGESCFYLALSFVSGFSERLAQDLVAQVEERLGHGTASSGATPPP